MTIRERLAAWLVEPSKAVTGPGALWMEYHTPLSRLSRNPQKLIAEAEALFHTNPWINAAERAINGRLASVPWHLEDDAGDTLDADSGPLAQQLLDLIGMPSRLRSRRQLWSLTSRHEGLTGNAAWFKDQRNLLTGIPAQIIYVNPARLTAAEDRDGNLLGWVVDDQNNPNTPAGVSATPLEVDEVMHFVLDEPDWGHMGIGIAEAAQSKAELVRLADRHTAQVMSSGGRLAGIIAPKVDAVINDDQWNALVRDYRNIVSDPESAKRLQVIRGPVDFTRTTADPSEMQLADLMTMGRDDILAEWHVPPSQIGIRGTVGLNSGDTVKFDEAALWQGAIDARLTPMVELIQRELVDPFAALGLVARLIVDTPAFDDLQPLFENATKAAIIPLTNNERRGLVGLDPLEDPALGDAVFLSQTMVPVTLLAPEPVPPPFESKAKADRLTSPLLGLRSRTTVTWEPRLRRAVDAVLAEQSRSIAARVVERAGHLTSQPNDETVWWHSRREDRRWATALNPLIDQLAAEVAGKVERVIAPPGKAFIDDVLVFIRKQVADRITAINDTTRRAVQSVIAEGVAAGLSPAELGRTIREATAFNEARSEMIARTETALAYNDSALSTYTEFGVEQVQAIDGDEDPECAARDGQILPVDEAFAITDHPNGTLDWVPIASSIRAKAAPAVVFGEGAIQVDVHPNEPAVIHVAAAQAPNVTVEAPSVTVAAAKAPNVTVTPQITVESATINVPESPAPIVNVEAKAASPNIDVRVLAQPPRRKRVTKRDPQGRISEVIEE